MADVELANVDDKITKIKNCMPVTYRAIQERAAKAGGQAYEVVRRALRGEADCFFAIEAGYVMGTVFKSRDVAADIALALIEFPDDAVVIWAPEVCIKAVDTGLRPAVHTRAFEMYQHGPN